MFGFWNKPNIGIALGGGGVLGAVHIGVLKAFEDNKIKPKAISGTSAGAVIGACAAFGLSLDMLDDIALSMNWAKMTGLPNSTLGITTNSGLGKILDKLVGKKNLEEAKIPFRVMATNVETGRKEIFNSGLLSACVSASCAVPILFSPVNIGGKLYVDGGVVENVPLSALDDMDLDLIVGVDLFGYDRQFKPKNIADMTEFCAFVFSKHKDIKIKTPVVMLKPNLSKYDQIDFDNVKELIEIGYQEGLKAVKTVESKLY